MKAGRETLGSADELQAAARAITGLDDFGDDDSYAEALDVLVDSYVREAGLTPWGNRVNFAMLRGALVARLLSNEARRHYPEHADVAIERPVIVTGLPRTGTTALHRLLCEDQAHQGLEMWLTEAPQPRPPRESWEHIPAFQHIQQRYEHHYVEHSEFMGVHHMSADMVEECWQLLRQSMTSVSFETLAHVPSYSRWLETRDWTPAYRRHRQNLQVIGLPGAGRRWVLKNPSHLFALDAIMTVYAGALVVQTHRDPRAVIASVSSLASQATAGQSTVFEGDVVGRDALDLWARGAGRFMNDRTRHDASHFIDVRYDDFVADPLGTVGTIYQRLGVELTPAAREAMASLHAESTSGERRPAHRYELSDFGLTASDVDERFERYRKAYLE